VACLDLELLRIGVSRALELAGLPLSDVQSSPTDGPTNGGSVDVVASEDLSAVVVGWVCSDELTERASSALDRGEEDASAVVLQDSVEAAVGRALGEILAVSGFTTRPRTDLPDSHQLVVTGWK
jgi:hypothetical protein